MKVGDKLTVPRHNFINFVCESIDELDQTCVKSRAISKAFEKYRLNPKY